jgi:hypothetical protein
MKKLHELISKVKQDDPSDTAHAVCDLLLNEEQTEYLFPLIKHECRRLDRAAARLGEQVVGENFENNAPKSERQAFHAQVFYNGETYVTWGSATIADHLGRIDFQQSLKNGIDNNIELHRWAIEQIEAHGVECLDQIEEPETT